MENRFNKYPKRLDDISKPRLSIFEETGVSHIEKMKNKIFERLKYRRQNIFKKYREK